VGFLMNLFSAGVLAPWRLCVMDRKTLLTIVAAVFIAGWFFWFAGAGLWADFSEDDVMNLHHYWRMPPERLLLGCFWLPPTVYRPGSWPR